MKAGWINLRKTNTFMRTLNSVYNFRIFSDFWLKINYNSLNVIWLYSLLLAIYLTNPSMRTLQVT